MKVYFRTDASYELGIGHVMRCLVLASELANKGASIAFICQELPGNISGHIEERGFTVYRIPVSGNGHFNPLLTQQNNHNQLPEQELSDARCTKSILTLDPSTADWLIVDHYYLSAIWEAHIHPLVKNLMVIDDLANRPHDCDLILDQNLYDNVLSRYENLLPEKCIKLFGPQYLLISPQFNRRSKDKAELNKRIIKVLITMGGSDALNMTLWSLTCILDIKIPDQLELIIVTGSAYKSRLELRQLAQNSRLHKIVILHDVSNMADLMQEADIAISAGGFTVYELMASRVPTLVIAANHSQVQAMEKLYQIGAIDYAGKFCQDMNERFKNGLLSLINDFERRKSLVEVSSRLFNNGGVERVVSYLLN